MRHYNEFGGLWRAPLFNKAFYQDVGARWKGIGLMQMLLVLILTWLVVDIKGTVSISGYISSGQAAKDLKDIPPITLKDGKASSPVEQPYVVKDTAGRAIFVMDTTGQYKAPSDVPGGTQLLLTDTDLIQVDASGRVQTTPVKIFGDMKVDKDWFISWIETFRNLLLPVGWPVTFLFFWAYRLVMALVFAALGLLIAMGFGAKLSYGTLLRLTMMAMVADVYIGMIERLTNFDIGCAGWFVGHALSLGYLVYAIKVNASLQNEGRSKFPMEPAPVEGPPHFH